MSGAFTELVGCRQAVQQAPMGGVATPDLAVAVADAGGLGTIVALGLPADRLAGILGKMTARTTGALCVNFLTAGFDREAVAAAAEGGARVIDFFWFDPDPAAVELAHQGGALASWQVGSANEAKAAVDAGCDFLTVQGTEAGGHVRGDQPLETLLDAVLRATGHAVPVLAAGGIADAATAQRIVAAGADGVRAGTRFIATDEAGAHPGYKQAIVNAGAGDTEITDAFSTCPLCATSPRHRALRVSIEALRATTDEPGLGMPPTTAATGNIHAMAMYAGESVAAIHDIRPAAAVVDELGNVGHQQAT